MWNMATYKFKLKISRIESETNLSRTENHIFALKKTLSANTKKSLGRHKKIGQSVATNALRHFFLHLLTVDVNCSAKEIMVKTDK